MRGSTLNRGAGVAGLTAPVALVAVYGLELAHANIGRSIIARPERFFSDAAWHLPLVALVAVVAVAVTAACLGLLMAANRLEGRSGVLGAGLLGAACLCRVGMAALLPADPHGYTVGSLASVLAWAFLATSPLALVALAVSLRRGRRGLAWLSAGLSIAMVLVGFWAVTWAARSGAVHPELLAVEPIGGLLALWSAAAGATLLGWPARFDSRRPRLALPAPGRKSAAALGLVLVSGVVGMTGSFVGSFGPAMADQLTGRTRVETIRADSVDRTYRAYVPASLSRNPGLVVVLHGSFGSGFQAQTMTGFDKEAERLGWIAVYPDGVADGWDAFGSGPTWGDHPGADDVAFIRGLIDRFEATDGVDPNRIYVTGHSRGGMMAYRVGCELSDVVAAIAPVSGNMATAAGTVDVPCAPARPVSVLALHGTADGTIPIAGGRVDIIFSPMADVIARWRSLDDCAETATASVEGAVASTTWACAAGNAVETRTYAGGCHCWFGDASRVIADFFAAHPRTPVKLVGLPVVFALENAASGG
jgi:polyhydroxybutyrate depolymerase